MGVGVPSLHSETEAQMRRLDQTRAVAAPDSQLHLISAIVAGDDHNPFSFLGMHKDSETGDLVIRAFHPGATRVAVLLRKTGEEVAQLVRTHDAGFFSGAVARGSDRFPYKLRLSFGATDIVIDDPYAFGPVLGELERVLASGDRDDVAVLHAERNRVLAQQHSIAFVEDGLAVPHDFGAEFAGVAA